MPSRVLIPCVLLGQTCGTSAVQTWNFLFWLCNRIGPLRCESLENENTSSDSPTTASFRQRPVLNDSSQTFSVLPSFSTSREGYEWYPPHTPTGSSLRYHQGFVVCSNELSEKVLCPFWTSSGVYCLRSIFCFWNLLDLHTSMSSIPLISRELPALAEPACIILQSPIACDLIVW